MKIITLFLLMTISLFSTPKAIVFDFGGVLAGFPDREAVVEFLRENLATPFG